MRTVDLIGVAMGLGGPDTAAAGGPARLRRAKLAEHLNELGVTTHWSPRLHPEPLAEQTAAARRDVSTELNGRVAHRITQSLGIGRAPLVLGGDHSIAAGTWAGVARSVGGPGKIGLVWIDAHMDAHTPATTPSGNPHGMPLATLLGADGSVPAVTPEHVALIGVRSYEAGEAALLKRLGVRIYYQAEVDARGVDIVLHEAIARARGANGCYGLTLDLDAIDPYDAPGTGTHAAGGIAARELLPAMRVALEAPGLIAAELVEYAPRHDPRERTLTIALELAVILGESLARSVCNVPTVNHSVHNPRGHP